MSPNVEESLHIDNKTFLPWKWSRGKQISGAVSIDLIRTIYSFPAQLSSHVVTTEQMAVEFFLSWDSVLVKLVCMLVVTPKSSIDLPPGYPSHPTCSTCLGCTHNIVSLQQSWIQKYLSHKEFALQIRNSCDLHRDRGTQWKQSVNIVLCLDRQRDRCRSRVRW